MAVCWLVRSVHSIACTCRWKLGLVSRIDAADDNVGNSGISWVASVNSFCFNQKSSFVDLLADFYGGRWRMVSEVKPDTLVSLFSSFLGVQHGSHLVCTWTPIFWLTKKVFQAYRITLLCLPECQQLFGVSCFLFKNIAGKVIFKWLCLISYMTLIHRIWSLLS